MVVTMLTLHKRIEGQFDAMPNKPDRHSAGWSCLPWARLSMSHGRARRRGAPQRFQTLVCLAGPRRRIDAFAIAAAIPSVVRLSKWHPDGRLEESSSEARPSPLPPPGGPSCTKTMISFAWADRGYSACM
jgi:hypothetical protein